MTDDRKTENEANEDQKARPPVEQFPLPGLVQKSGHDTADGP